MIEIVREIEAAWREVGSGLLAGGEARVIRLGRTYDAPIDDVWDALTDPERITRWFLPISGDYRLGGRFQFEGNAGGTILACEAPTRLRVTWEYGDPSAPPSEVEIRLAPEGEGTALELEHVAIVPDEFWDQFGPGAVGVGWDGGLLGLTLHLRGGSVGDPIAWQLSEEGRAFFTRSSEAWGVASTSAGMDPTAVASMVANTTAFYAPPTPPEIGQPA
jgi:uncharacterized protein YndB with AHSA1/START domain